LHDLGLERFRGLIDRDTGNLGETTIKVLRRHSFENYLYDPLTLSAFLIHRGITAPLLNLRLNRVDATELLHLNQVQLQSMVDGFCNWLSGESSEESVSNSPKVSASYVGFPNLNLPSWWIDTNGHELDSFLKRFLNPLGNTHQRGALVKSDKSEIVTFQTKTLPELISLDLRAIFRELQNPN